MRILRNISLICLTIVSLQSYAQNYTSKAYNFYVNKDNSNAKIYIDSAVFNSEEKQYSKTWQLRGVIYRNLEKEDGIESREIAIQSFVTARTVDTENEFSQDIYNYLFNLNIRYYNDAVEKIQSGNLDDAELSYIVYKSNFSNLLLEEKEFKTQDIEFYTALGAAWFKKNKTTETELKENVYKNAINAFQKVIDYDSLNFDCNRGIGISYYNQGADLIMNMNPFATDLEEIDYVQTKSINILKKGEPYLLIAFAQDNNNIDVVEALTGIYYSLNETEKYEKFNTLLKKLLKEKAEE